VLKSHTTTSKISLQGTKTEAVEQENLSITSKLQAVLWGALVLVCLPVINCLRQLDSSQDVVWVGLLVVLATGITIVSLSRELPAQNSIFASILIAAIAIIIQVVVAHGGPSLGQYFNPLQPDDKLFHKLVWAAPLLWVVVLLNARGVARLILQSARRTKNYGIWVLVVTVLLVMFWQLGFEPLVNKFKANHYGTSKNIHEGWYGNSWFNFVKLAVIVSATLLLVTPSLINKSPKETRLSVQPLFIWLLLSSLVIISAWVHQLLGVLLLTFGQATFSTIFALHGNGLGKGHAKEIIYPQLPKE